MRAFRIAGGIRPGHLAAVLAFAVDGLYLALIGQQGNGGSRVAFVAISIAGAGATCAMAELAAGFAAGAAAAAATATFWIWVLLGAFSIGLFLVPAGVLTTVSLTRRKRAASAISLGIAAAPLIAAVGLARTS